MASRPPRKKAQTKPDDVEIAPHFFLVMHCLEALEGCARWLETHETLELHAVADHGVDWVRGFLSALEEPLLVLARAWDTRDNAWVGFLATHTAAECSNRCGFDIIDAVGRESHVTGSFLARIFRAAALDLLSNSRDTPQVMARGTTPYSGTGCPSNLQEFVPWLVSWRVLHEAMINHDFQEPLVDAARELSGLTALLDQPRIHVLLAAHFRHSAAFWFEKRPEIDALRYAGSADARGNLVISSSVAYDSGYIDRQDENVVTMSDRWRHGSYRFHREELLPMGHYHIQRGRFDENSRLIITRHTE